MIKPDQFILQDSDISIDAPKKKAASEKCNKVSSAPPDVPNNIQVKKYVDVVRNKDTNVEPSSKAPRANTPSTTGRAPAAVNPPSSSPVHTGANAHSSGRQWTNHNVRNHHSGQHSGQQNSQQSGSYNSKAWSRYPGKRRRSNGRRGGDSANSNQNNNHSQSSAASR